MNISLYGINGLYNFGCEAIVRGTTAIIRRFCPSATIRYYSPRSKEDSRRVADLGIDVVQLNPGHRSILLRLLNKAAMRLCLSFDSTREDYDSVLDDADLLISIGGDIYTIPAHLRERQRYPYFNQLVKIGALAKQRGIPELIIGASIGPFGDYVPAVDYYRNHLREISLICCREVSSIKYLSSIGVEENVCLFPDPAFFVEGLAGPDAWKDSEFLGVNLSPLSLRELYGGYADSDAANLAALVAQLMDVTGLPTLLIPHVLAPQDGDNDLVFLQKIYSLMDGDHRTRTDVVMPNGFLDAKRHLRRCRLVVAARMHCAVNAICEGVPTVFLSYSQKAQGMCEFVYGSSRWVLPLGDAERELPGRLAELDSEATSVHEGLVRRIASIRSSLSADEGFGRFAALLSDTDGGEN